MRLVSWNVNGLRACVNKGFLDVFKDMDADIFCIQETKMQPDQLKLELDGYKQYFYNNSMSVSGLSIFLLSDPIFYKIFFYCYQAI